jgi:hypothetical protein
LVCDIPFLLWLMLGRRNGRGDGSKIGPRRPQRKCRLASIAIADRYPAGAGAIPSTEKVKAVTFCGP